MKCKQVQQRLLATSGRRKLPHDVVAHLDGCSHCQKWHTQLGLIDRSVRHLPVPDSSETKAALIAQFLEPVVPASRWSLQNTSVTWQRALVGLAASLIVLAAAISLLRTNRRTQDSAAPTDQLLARVLDKNMQLAIESSPAKRLQTLEKIADDLDSETRTLALLARTEDLNELARMYDKVIRDGLLRQAGNMSVEEKARDLPTMADRFFASSQRAEEAAKGVPPAVAGPLKSIANTARFATDTLRQAAAAAATEPRIKFAQDGPAPGGQS